MMLRRKFIQVLAAVVLAPVAAVKALFYSKLAEPSFIMFQGRKIYYDSIENSEAPALYLLTKDGLVMLSGSTGKEITWLSGNRPT